MFLLFFLFSSNFALFCQGFTISPKIKEICKIPDVGRHLDPHPRFCKFPQFFVGSCAKIDFQIENLALTIFKHVHILLETQ